MFLSNRLSNKLHIYGKIYNKYTYKAANEPFFKYLKPTAIESKNLANIKLYDVHSSYSRTLCLGRKKDGKNILLGSGNNYFGQLGLFMNKNLGMSEANVPSFVKEFEIVNIPEFGLEDDKTDFESEIKICSGLNHTIIYRPGSRLAFVSGSNAYGQCGLQDEKIKMALGWIPMSLPNTFTVKSICCGLDHTLLLLDSGHVYSCGLNTDNQAGNPDPSVTSQHFWKRLEFPNNVLIEEIHTGDDFNFVQDVDGLWYSWGNNELQQLALPVTVDKVSQPTQTDSFMQSIETLALGNSYGLGMTKDNRLKMWGRFAPGISPITINKHTPVYYDKVDSDSRITNIYASTDIAACITENNQIYVWGRTFKPSIHDWTFDNAENKPVFFTFPANKTIQKFSLSRFQATMLIK